MAVVYIIVAVIAGVVAGVLTYGAAGLLWAIVAYVGAGTLAVFVLAAWRALTPKARRKPKGDRTARRAARVHPAEY